jgi:prepilin-type N-terminal cleavage/methylation domain-containing protein
MKKNGFTLVELITVLILLGILSAIALPRFFDNDSFTSFFDQTEFASALSWTRNRAITSQCAHEFRITSSGWMVLRDDDRDVLTTNDCESDSLGNACSGNEFFSFIYRTDDDILQDASGTRLTGTDIASSTTQRLIFSSTGKLYRLATLPPNAGTAADDGCTAVPGASLLANGSTILLNNGLSLTADGATAYVAIQ